MITKDENNVMSDSVFTEEMNKLILLKNTGQIDEEAYNSAMYFLHNRTYGYPY